MTSKRHFLASALLFALTLTGSSLAWSAGLFEREVIFSEAEIQSALAKGAPQLLTYNGLLHLTLPKPPKITLGQTEGRAGIATKLELTLPGKPPIPVDIAGSAGVRYDEKSKSFYLDNPVAESVSSPALDPKSAPLLELAISQMMASYFRNKPVYVLRDDASPQEATARWLLKSVRIEPGRVVATLSTI